MATVTVNMTLEQWQAYMRDLGKNFIPTAVRGVQSGALRCVKVMQDRTKEAPPASEHGKTGAFNYGRYHASWRSNPLPNGAEVRNDAPYSSVIEYGRRPAAVSRQGKVSLERWAQRKLGLNAVQAKDAAWAIAQTLKTRPLRARKVMSGGLDQMVKIVNDEVDAEMQRALGRKPK